MANDTTKLGFAVPSTIAFTRAGVDMTFDVAQVVPHKDILARIFYNGLVQKVGDAAAGAKKAAEEAYTKAHGKEAWTGLGDDERTELVTQAASDMMAAVIENLAAGEWGRTRDGSDTDPLDRFRAGVVRGLFKFPGNATEAAKAKRLLGGKTVDINLVNELVGNAPDTDPSDSDVNRARVAYLVRLAATGGLVDANGKAVSSAAIDKAATVAMDADTAKKAAEAAMFAGLGDITV